MVYTSSEKLRFCHTGSETWYVRNLGEDRFTVLAASLRHSDALHDVSLVLEKPRVCGLKGPCGRQGGISTLFLFFQHGKQAPVILVIWVSFFNSGVNLFLCLFFLLLDELELCAGSPVSPGSPSLLSEVLYRYRTEHDC